MFLGKLAENRSGLKEKFLSKKVFSGTKFIRNETNSKFSGGKCSLGPILRNETKNKFLWFLSIKFRVKL